MTILLAVIGIVLIVGALADAFEVVLLPRPIKRWLRPTGIFFNVTWPLWTAVAALCATYEPILFGLSAYLLLPLPDWVNIADLQSQRGDWGRVVARLSNMNGLTPQRPD